MNHTLSKFKATPTEEVGEVSVGVNDPQGASFIIVFPMLRSNIKKLSEDEFLRAWWHVVVCKCPQFLYSLFY